MFAAIIALAGCCRKTALTHMPGEMKITVEQGREWLHSFPLFWGIKIKNPPQIAIWTEDPEGCFIETIYVSRRTAQGKWRGGREIKRPEALPVWSNAIASKSAEKGTSEVPDAVTGATPRAGFQAAAKPALRKFVVKIELNHSCDWNDAWPADAPVGSPQYSAESGQPAVVYAAEVDLDSCVRRFEAVPIGYSSPDGTDGIIRPDLSSLTTALHIIDSIIIEYAN